MSNPLDFRNVGLDIAKLYEEAELYIISDIKIRMDILLSNPKINADEIIENALDKVNWREEVLKIAKKQRGNLKELYDDISIEVSEEINNALSDVYFEGYRESIKDVPDTIPLNVARLATETASKVGSMASPILRQVDDVYRELAGSTVLNAYTRGLTVRQATQEMLSKMAKQGISKFIDKKGRQWDSSSYCEMAIRTAAAETYRQGFMDAEVKSGNNLVYVSSHVGSCDLCLPWEGKILRIRDDIENSDKDDIIKMDNVSVRKWYIEEVAKIHDEIDAALPIEERARQAFERRNEIRRNARNLMSDEKTKKRLDEEYPEITFEKLLKSKMMRKGMTKEEAIEDIFITAVTTNQDINRELGLEGE